MRGQYFERLELDTGWMRDAACVDIPGLPWIENPNHIPAVLAEVMAQTCAACPVLTRCEEFVEEAAVTAGFWAGRSRAGKNVADYHAPTRTTPQWVPVYSKGRLVEEQAAIPMPGPDGAALDAADLDGAA